MYWEIPHNHICFPVELFLFMSVSSFLQCFPDKTALLEKAKMELKSLTSIHEVCMEYLMASIYGNREAIPIYINMQCGMSQSACSKVYWWETTAGVGI